MCNVAFKCFGYHPPKYKHSQYRYISHAKNLCETLIVWNQLNLRNPKLKQRKIVFFGLKNKDQNSVIRSQFVNSSHEPNKLSLNFLIMKIFARDQLFTMVFFVIRSIGVMLSARTILLFDSRHFHNSFISRGPVRERKKQHTITQQQQHISASLISLARMICIFVIY